MSMMSKSTLASICLTDPLPSTPPTDGSHMKIPRELPDGSSDVRFAHAIPHSSRSSGLVRVGLVDSFAFTRGCLIEALTTPEHGFSVTAFESTGSFVLSGAREIDVILYYDHEQARSRTLDTSWDAAIRERFGDVPIIVLSDATTALDPQTIREALKCGVRGFISTRTFEVKTVSAAIRFVTAGGVFAPVDLLLADDERSTTDRQDTAPPDGLLTPRQTTVLSLLQQGKANKIIAYELGMSESTVKVHIRNIMRKIGATNRTQAIYKLQQFLHDRGIEACTAL
jgi:DNA-binding NarL/FixJ family response regulator